MVSVRRQGQGLLLLETVYNLGGRPPTPLPSASPMACFHKLKPPEDLHLSLLRYLDLAEPIFPSAGGMELWLAAFFLQLLLSPLWAWSLPWQPTANPASLLDASSPITPSQTPEHTKPPNKSYPTWILNSLPGFKTCSNIQTRGCHVSAHNTTFTNTLTIILKVEFSAHTGWYPLFGYDIRASFWWLSPHHHYPELLPAFLLGGGGLFIHRLPLSPR